MEAISDWMAGLGLAYYMNEYGWLWPLCEILHFVSMSLLVGTIGAMDLRILGFAKSIPIAALERLVPLGIAAFAVNAATGFAFVAGNTGGPPLDYLTNLSYRFKMALIAIAGLNALAFYVFGGARRAAAVRAGGEATVPAKLVAVLSIACWIGVICFGRLIMYDDVLQEALGVAAPGAPS